MFVEMVGFSAPKSSNAPTEWEDGARFDECWRAGKARLIVADGATEAFDVIRWVAQLVDSFVSALGEPTVAPPEIEPASMAAWVAQMQGQWAQEAPEQFATFFEAEKFRTSGAYATMLGCEIANLNNDDRPALWRAVAVGDTVLFQVRAGRLLQHFPALNGEDFSNRPDLVYSDMRRFEEVVAAFRFESGELRRGDTLYVATDAFAHWMIDTCADQATNLWSVLATIDGLGFGRLVDEQRAKGRLHDDDVTLLRARVVETPSALVVRR